MTNSPTIPTTIAEIMADPKFGLGVADVRAGRGQVTAEAIAWFGRVARYILWGAKAPSNMNTKHRPTRWARNGWGSPGGLREATE